MAPLPCHLGNLLASPQSIPTPPVSPLAVPLAYLLESPRRIPLVNRLGSLQALPLEDPPESRAANLPLGRPPNLRVSPQVTHQAFPQESLRQYPQSFPLEGHLVSQLLSPLVNHQFSKAAVRPVSPLESPLGSPLSVPLKRHRGRLSALSPSTLLPHPLVSLVENRQGSRLSDLQGCPPLDPLASHLFSRRVSLPENPLCSPLASPLVSPLGSPPLNRPVSRSPPPRASPPCNRPLPLLLRPLLSWVTATTFCLLP